jgi:hypothetical protein
MQVAMKSATPIAAAAMNFNASVSGKRGSGSIDRKNLRNRNVTVTGPSQSISIHRVYE